MWVMGTVSSAGPGGWERLRPDVLAKARAAAQAWLPDPCRASLALTSLYKCKGQTLRRPTPSGVLFEERVPWPARRLLLEAQAETGQSCPADLVALCPHCCSLGTLWGVPRISALFPQNRSGTWGWGRELGVGLESCVLWCGFSHSHGTWRQDGEGPAAHPAPTALLPPIARCWGCSPERPHCLRLTHTQKGEGRSCCGKPAQATV